jgi:bifunctional non-homologous end joining protein LigD
MKIPFHLKQYSTLLILTMLILHNGKVDTKMATERSLTKYRLRRDFTKTAEPKGEKIRAKSKNRFVIHKHTARLLHYDLRLEIDGILASWAIPKGPSEDPKIKRLAIQTEDHPLAYANFEGVIAEGNYGAGTVMIWDYGTYRSLKKNVTIRKQIDEGVVEICFNGKKIRGNYALIKTKNEWLLIKMKDTKILKKISIAKNRSAKTGRTMKEIEEEISK